MTWRIFLISENQKTESEPNQQHTSEYETLIVCPCCKGKFTDIYSHFDSIINNPFNVQKGKRKKKRLKELEGLRKLKKEHSFIFNEYKIRPITAPLISFPEGFRNRRNTLSCIINNVFSCNHCKIKFSHYACSCRCPICGCEPDTCEKGEGKIDYELTYSQIKAMRSNLEIARKVRSKEAEKSKEISFKPPPSNDEKGSQWIEFITCHDILG